MEVALRRGHVHQGLPLLLLSVHHHFGVHEVALLVYFSVVIFHVGIHELLGFRPLGHFVLDAVLLLSQLPKGLAAALESQVLVLLLLDLPLLELVQPGDEAVDFDQLGPVLDLEVLEPVPHRFESQLRILLVNQ